MEFVSEGCRKITGYAPEDLLHNSRIAYTSIIHPDDRERVRSEIFAALAERRRFDVEYRIVCADGGAKWVWERGVAVHGTSGAQFLEGIVEDITERKAALENLAAAEQRYRSIFENAIEGIFQATVEGHYLSANPALARIYGYASPKALIQAMQDSSRQLYVDPARRSEFLRLMREQGYVTDFELQVYRSDGTVIWTAESARAVRGAGGTVSYFEGSVEDITDRKRYQAELEHQASHDALTGLPNRTLLEDRVEQAIGHAQRRSQIAVVAFVDLDHFKVINDSLGHATGDEVLVRIAERLRATLRETDTVARHGGDEFVLVLGEQPHVGAVVTLIERVIAEIARPVLVDGHELVVTCSLGLAVYPNDGADVATLLRNADAAMYSAKDQGRNTFEFYAPSMNLAALERLAMETTLRRSVERDELDVHYQPRVAIATGRIIGVEALVRWQVKTGAFVPPAQFISIAEDSNLIGALGENVLRAACRQGREWHARGYADFLVSVNLSARQFRGGALVPTIARVLRESGLKPSCLELELTEGSIMGHDEAFGAMFQELKALGVRLAIDDFGTGYSNLSYLARFPLDTLKIDRTFVSNVTEMPQAASLAKAVVSLGHSLGLTVVAEGVETAAQLRFMREQGCDEMQGYYISPPVPAAELDALLARGLNVG